MRRSEATNPSSIPGSGTDPNASPARRRTTSSGVAPSSWLVMKCSASPKRKNRPVTGSFRTTAPSCRLITRSLRSLGSAAPISTSSPPLAGRGQRGQLPECRQLPFDYPRLMVPIGLRVLVACRPFRNRTVGNSVVVVVVVGVVRVVVQRPDGVRRNPLLELFDL